MYLPKDPELLKLEDEIRKLIEERKRNHQIYLPIKYHRKMLKRSKLVIGIKEKNYIGNTSDKLTFVAKNEKKKRIVSYGKYIDWKLLFEKSVLNYSVYQPRIHTDKERKIILEDFKKQDVHGWIKAMRGSASYCTINRSHKGRFEWANISRKYKYEIHDWISLCKACHMIFDASRMTVKELKEGEKRGQEIISARKNNRPIVNTKYQNMRKRRWG